MTLIQEVGFGFMLGFTLLATVVEYLVYVKRLSCENRAFKIFDVFAAIAVGTFVPIGLILIIWGGR